MHLGWPNVRGIAVMTAELLPLITLHLECLTQACHLLVVTATAGLTIESRFAFAKLVRIALTSQTFIKWVYNSP